MGAHNNSVAERRLTPRVSAVIATVGRSSLRATVESVHRQSVPLYEVIVVNDSPNQISVTADLCTDVTEEFTGGSRGPSAARNRGVNLATGDLIAYLDDDDVWLPDHIAGALYWFDELPELDLYSCVMLESHASSQEPSSKVVYSGRRSLIDFFYGRYCWAGRRRSIPPSTWVFRRETCNVPMDENLAVHEDIWFLLNLDNRGKCIRQWATIGGLKFSDATRTQGRDTTDVLVDWIDRLESLREGSGRRFLIGVKGREYARTGMRDEWTEMMTRQPGWKVPWDYRMVYAVEKIALSRRRGQRRS